MLSEKLDNPSLKKKIDNRNNLQFEGLILVFYEYGVL